MTASSRQHPGRLRPRHVSRLLPWAVGMALLVGRPAVAGEAEEALARVEGDVERLVASSRSLEQAVTTDAGELRGRRARDRFREGVYRFLLGDYQESAEAFFVLVTSEALAGSPLALEAEWYLAESLFELRNDELAEAWLRSVAGTDGHPFRDDAVRRLLELYARSGDAARFDQVFGREILSGKVKPTDVIVYSVAKAFRTKGDRAQARTWFQKLGPGSDHWFRARYFLGAMHVEDGSPFDLQSAIDVFLQLRDAEPRTAEDRQVRDLGLLALGRLHRHLGQHAEAVAAYEAIADDSRVDDARLRELVWTHIDQGELGRAVESVDVFLRRYPGHQWTAELRLLRGHLQFERGAWDAATSAYGDVIDAYGPVRARYADLAADPDLEDDVALVASWTAPEADDATVDAAIAGGEEALPAYTVPMLREDAALDMALTIHAELTRMGEVLEASEALVAALDDTLGGDGDVPVTEQVRRQALGTLVDVLLDQLVLVDVEAARLRRLDPSTPPRVDAMASELRAVREQIERMGSTALGANDAVLRALSNDLAAARTRVDGLVQAHVALRADVGLDAQMDPTSLRLDALQATLDDAADRLSAVDAQLDEIGAEQLEQLRATFRKEAAAVRGQRAAWDDTFAQAEAVGEALLRRGFEQLAEFFEESVLGADMGVVNVAWTRWVALGDERKGLTEQRNEALGDLAERYGFARERLEQGR